MSSQIIAPAAPASVARLVVEPPEQLTPDELLEQMPPEEVALLAQMPVTSILLAWVASLKVGQPVASSPTENTSPKRRSPFSRSRPRKGTNRGGTRRKRGKRPRDPEGRLAAAQAALAENPGMSKSQLARELGISRSWAGELRRRVLTEVDRG